jgi:hypothetical protein
MLIADINNQLLRAVPRDPKIFKRNQAGFRVLLKRLMSSEHSHSSTSIAATAIGFKDHG